MWMALPLFGFVAAAHAEDVLALPQQWSELSRLGAPTEQAAPFRLDADMQTRDRAEACLATAIYYEAGDQSREGQQAVAQVVLNRLHHPSFPKSVCGVVYQGLPTGRCQFTFACDGSLARSPDARGWREARTVADQALDGFVSAAAGFSTHYHTVWVHPAWSARLTPTRRIGAHQFYQMAKAGTQLTGVYSGSEPTIGYPVAYRSAGPAPATQTDPTPPGARTAPRAGTFQAWGLQIATVAPKTSGGVLVMETAESASVHPALPTPAADGS